MEFALWKFLMPPCQLNIQIGLALLFSKLYIHHLSVRSITWYMNMRDCIVPKVEFDYYTTTVYGFGLHSSQH